MAETIPRIGDLSAVEKLMFREKYDAMIFDLDGTLMDLKGVPLPGVQDAILAISRTVQDIFLITDKTAFTKKDLAQRVRLHFPEFNEENIFTSQWLITHHLRSIDFDKRIYVIGSKNGLVKELKEAGYQVEYDEVREVASLSDVLDIEYDPEVGAVIIGNDVNYSYVKLVKAANYVSNPSNLFIVTHTPLAACHDPIIPAGGALSLPVEALTGRRPWSCGKSTGHSAQFLSSLVQDPGRCLFVGDAPNSDITCGNRCGMDTLFVLSGSYTLSDLDDALSLGQTLQKPTYIANSVAQLLKIYN